MNVGVNHYHNTDPPSEGKTVRQPLPLSAWPDNLSLCETVYTQKGVVILWFDLCFYYGASVVVAFLETEEAKFTFWNMSSRTDISRSPCLGWSNDVRDCHWMLTTLNKQTNSYDKKANSLGAKLMISVIQQ